MVSRSIDRAEEIALLASEIIEKLTRTVSDVCFMAAAPSLGSLACTTPASATPVAVPAVAVAAAAMAAAIH